MSRTSPTTKKPVVALLVNSFWNSGAGISGGDQRVIQVFNRLSKQFTIDVYTSLDGKKAVADKISGANCITAPEALNRGNVFLTYQKRTAWGKKEILKKKYDLIYSSSDFLPDVIPAAEYFKQNPGTVWLQCVFHLYPKWWSRPGGKVKNMIGQQAQQLSLKIIKKASSGVIVINNDVRKYLLQKGFASNKIFLNPCGADLDFYQNIKVVKQPLQVAFLARLSESKGIFDLPIIWKNVVKKIPDAKLLILGGGSPENAEKLKVEIHKLSLSKNIKILGYLPDKQAFEQIKSSQLFLFPSYEEGFGMVIAEAMACGLPVVSWDLPVYSEVFQKGLVQVPIRNIEQMAERVVDLLNDPKQVAKCGAEGHEWVKRYGLDGIANTELAVINSLLNLKELK